MAYGYSDYHAQMAIYLLRDIPTELWHRVKVRAAIDGQTLRQVLLNALEQYAKAVRLDPVTKRRRNVKRQ